MQGVDVEGTAFPGCVVIPFPFLPRQRGQSFLDQLAIQAQGPLLRELVDVCAQFRHLVHPVLVDVQIKPLCPWTRDSVVMRITFGR